MADNYKLIFRPKHLSNRLPELIVLDMKNKPFRPLTEFYNHECQRISQQSAQSYLHSLIPFFTWLDNSSNYRGKSINWAEHPEVIREGVRSYLIEYLGLKVNEASNGSFQYVRFTKRSSSTAKRFLSALKNFYRSMIRKGYYAYENPMIDSNSQFLNENFNRMPDIAGTEVPHEKRRITDSYFKLVGSEWVPEIIDDYLLPSKVLEAGRKSKWRLREEVIARLLFETGARVSEIIEVTMGDYRQRQSVREMATFNKGSFGQRIKFVAFTNQTATLLRRYINGERKENDIDNLGFDNLPDEAPIFLTQRGTPFTYQAWYPHWAKATKSMGLHINPHKTRHWYVTQALRTIYETSSENGEIQRRTRELISYMKWISKETIEVYEHYFDAKRHLEIHDVFLKNLYKFKKKNPNVVNTKESISINSSKISESKQEIDMIDKFLLELE